jgi:hypothetical protein
MKRRKAAWKPVEGETVKSREYKVESECITYHPLLRIQLWSLVWETWSSSRRSIGCCLREREEERGWTYRLTWLSLLFIEIDERREHSRDSASVHSVLRSTWQKDEEAVMTHRDSASKSFDHVSSSHISFSWERHSFTSFYLRHLFLSTWMSHSLREKKQKEEVRHQSLRNYKANYLFLENKQALWPFPLSYPSDIEGRESKNFISSFSFCLSSAEMET